MNKFLIKLFPYLIILIGLFFLLFINMAPIAGVCFLLGIVMIILRIWPEKWDTTK